MSIDFADAPIDPFADPFDEGDATGVDGVSVSAQYIHIRNQQRNGKKSWTTVQGLNVSSIASKDVKLREPKDTAKPKKDREKEKKEDLLHDILKDMKRSFNCNGTVVEDSDLGQILQLSGDQRQNVSKYLIDKKIADKAFIKIHGA